MFIEVVTTITSRIPITDGSLGAPVHSVEITSESDLPEVAALATALGAARSVRDTILKQHPALASGSS